MAGYAVVGYMEFNTIWDVLPKKFKNDVDRRFTSELIAYPPIISLSVLASGIGLQKGKQNSPIRITYEVFGRYIDSSNPQCVMWEELEDELTGGWTTRSCTTQAEESYVSHKMGNVIKVNCTCWHLSTFALLIENNAVQVSTSNNRPNSANLINSDQNSEIFYYRTFRTFLDQLYWRISFLTLRLYLHSV